MISTESIALEHVALSIRHLILIITNTSMRLIPLYVSDEPCTSELRNETMKRHNRHTALMNLMSDFLHI